MGQSDPAGRICATMAGDRPASITTKCQRMDSSIAAGSQNWKRATRCLAATGDNGPAAIASYLTKPESTIAESDPSNRQGEQYGAIPGRIETNCRGFHGVVVDRSRP